MSDIIANIDVSGAGEVAPAATILTGCCVAIEPTTFSIVAATDSALAVLKLDRSTLPVALDAAMPLAEKVWQFRHPLADTKPANATQAQLWTRQLGKPLIVTLSLQNADDGAGLIIVSLPPPAKSSSDGIEAEDIENDAPRLIRSDVETLLEIGRRIRSGWQPSDGIAPPPVTPKAAAEPSPLAKLAHELKTPLGGIIAATEVMRDGRLGEIGNERYQAYLADMHDAAQHAFSLVTRWASGTDPARTVPAFQLPPANLSEIVRAGAGVMRPLADQLGLTIEVYAATSDLMIGADATFVRQILFNLLANSLKLTPAGGAVTVSATQTGDSRAVLSVRDTGIGLDVESARQSLIAASSLAEGSARQQIGFAVVGALARASAAVVEINSATGGGTEVRVIFQIAATPV